MRIISWNIQAARGVDNVVSIDRIAQVIKDLGDADVICCQEVLNCEIDGVESNQVQALSAHFPDHHVYFGAAIDRLQGPAEREGHRLQFGNLVLSRVPVLQQYLHRLPQPAEAGIPCMPRQAIELVVPFYPESPRSESPHSESRAGESVQGAHLHTSGQLCRIVTTHLDYFAAKQRAAQVGYLRELNQQTLERSRRPGAQGGDMQFAALAETDRAVYCGDFNLGVDSGDYQMLTTTAGGSDESMLFDCWRLVNPEREHDPTCGIFDRVQWSEGPHCRDFFFASAALASHVAAVEVDTNTDASDHQPLMLTLS